MSGPDPRTLHPMAGFPQIAYLRNVVTRPNIIVGDYTYYDDPEGVERFEQNVMYHFQFVGDKLIIGKFCALAKDVTVVMNAANQLMSGFSTYAFQIFGNGWERAMPPMDAFPRKRDTVVGNDGWIGYDMFVRDHRGAARRRLVAPERRQDLGNLERIMAADLEALRAAVRTPNAAPLWPASGRSQRGLDAPGAGRVRTPVGSLQVGLATPGCDLSRVSCRASLGGASIHATLSATTDARPCPFDYA